MNIETTSIVKIFVLPLVLILQFSCSPQQTNEKSPIGSQSIVQKYFDREVPFYKEGSYDKVSIEFNEVEYDWQKDFDYRQDGIFDPKHKESREVNFLREVRKLSINANVTIHEIDQTIQWFQDRRLDSFEEDEDFDVGNVETTRAEAYSFYESYLKIFTIENQNALILRIDDGNHVEFISESDGEEEIYYELLAYVSHINSYLVKMSYKGDWNNVGMGVKGLPVYLVNKKNGNIVELWDIPSINRDGSLILVTSFGNNVNHANIKGIQVFKRELDEISLLAEFETGNEPSVIEWINNTEALISCSNEGEYVERITIRHK